MSQPPHLNLPRPRRKYKKLRGPKTDKYDLPIWQLELEYEKRLRATVIHSSYVRASAHVYDFLICYPKKSIPADYFVTDVEDYLLKIERERGKGVARTAHEEIRAFFNWLKEEKGLRFANPVAKKKHPRHRREAPRIELEQLVALCQTAKVHPRDAAIVRLALQGIYGRALATALSIHSGTVRRRYERLRNAAGFPPVPLRLLRPAYNRLCLRLGEEAAQQQLGLGTFDVSVAEAAS